MVKNFYQFKTVCKGYVGYATQLKQQKNFKDVFLHHITCNVDLLLSNIIFYNFCCLVFRQV